MRGEGDGASRERTEVEGIPALGRGVASDDCTIEAAELWVVDGDSYAIAVANASGNEADVIVGEF